MAMWADDVARRVQERLGLPIPDAGVVHITARRPATESKGYVIKAQGWVDRRLVQKMIVVNPTGADGEDMLEAVCWLLCNRYVIARQSAEELAGELGATPDWFAVGLAQSLFPFLRARNGRRVHDRWARGHAMSVASVLEKVYLPEGRWSDKYACGVFVDWILDGRERQATVQGLMTQWAAGGRVNGPWLEGLQGISAGDIDTAWFDWVERQSLIERDPGTTSVEHLEQLAATLAQAPEDAGLRGGKPVGAWRLADLIPVRTSGRLSSFTGGLHVSLGRLAAGRSVEFREVVQRYEAFLLALAGHAEEGGTLNKPVPDSELAELLTAADEAFARLKQQMRLRDHYLDEVESRLAAGPDVFRARATAYLDRVEERAGTRP